MVATPDSFKFEDRLVQRLNELADLHDSLPPYPGPRMPPSIPIVNLVAAQETVSAKKFEFTAASEVDLTQTAVHEIQCESGTIRAQGNSLLCSCPDCLAPMTIRIWLKLADCWRCQTCISLTEEQLAAAQQLMENRPSEQRPQPVPSVIRFADPLRPVDDTTPPPVPVVDPREQELEKLTRGSTAARLIRRTFSLTPAWMISFLLHLIAILMLALFVLSDHSYIPNTITLSTFLDNQRQQGGKIRLENPLDQLQDDLALASKMEIGNNEIREVLQKANQDASELVSDPFPLAPLPDISHVRKNITTRPGTIMSFAARDPRVRAEIVQREGGTTITEAAVARGLRWLVSVQNNDGSWSLKDYRKHDRLQNSGDVMGTSLALLPLLGAGQTQEYGVYKKNVAAGLAWLIDNQNSNGDLRAGYSGQAGMYAHGQATIVLCEALALTGDQQLRDPAQRAIKFIEQAQHRDGGWRYRPGDVGDTSVFGWQMMALQSSRASEINLEVDPATLQLADYFLEQVAAPARFDNRKQTRLPDGAAYCYQPGRPATPAMTAEAILCRMYLGWKKQDPRLSAAIQWLIADHLPGDENKNLYYWYYGTQVMHHYGGEPWKIWNSRMRELLISSQQTGGAFPGSWDPGDYEWGSRGGRIYTTSLAVCTLEVYYRHLPIFQQIELDE